MTLIILEMHVTILGYLANRPFCITELSNGNTEECNILKGLDKAIIIPDNNDKHAPDLPNLKAKQTEKKDEKAKRRQLRRDTLANATYFPVANDSFLPLVAGNGALFLIFGAGLLFIIVDSAFLFAIGGGLLFLVIGDLLSLIVGGDFLFLIAGSSFLSPTADSGL